MNMIKVEPESDSETQEPYSEFQFIDVHQKFLSVPMPFTEMKTEIKVTKKTPDSIKLKLIPQTLKMETDSDSDAPHSYSEPEVTDAKDKHLLHPSIYSMWKYDVQMKDIWETHGQMPSQQSLYCESMNENEWFLHSKREKFKELMKERRRNESAEQREKRLNQMKEYAKHRRANESPEQRQKRLFQMNMYARQRRATESLDQRIKRLTQMNNYEKQRRANETSEQREERKRKRREIESSRRNNETPEERQKRLIQMTKYAKERRAAQSLQQSERQLSQINNYAKQGRLSETLEQKEDQNRQQQKEALQGTDEIQDQQEKWWRQREKRDAQRSAYETPTLHEEHCVQVGRLCKLQRTCETVEQIRAECIQEQDDCCRKQDTKVALCETNEPPELHKDRQKQENDVQRRTSDTSDVYEEHCRQQEMLLCKE